MINRTVFLYTCICLFMLLQVSCEKSKKINYYDNGGLKETREFFSRDDTSSYYLTSFFPNGKIMEEGPVVHSKKDGEWKEWFADGIFRREVFYKAGEPDMQYEGKEPVDIIFDTDSLKVGMPTSVKIINLYPSEGINCDGAQMLPSKDESYSDFIIIPDNSDSIHFYYINYMDKKNLVIIDSVKLKASEITDPAKYKLTDEDLKNIDSVVIITNYPKSVFLKSFPVYK